MKEYKNKQGQYHRTDGPSYEYEDGSKVWYLNDKLHRTDGPACEWVGGDKTWWLNGKLVYSDDENNLSQYDVSESFKRSIVKYELAR